MEPESRFSVSYQLFMLGLCVLVLGWLAVETLVPLDPDTREILFVADTAIALVFLGDFVASFVRSKNRARYMLTWGWIDLISSIPAVGFLRVGRAARIARVIRVLRAVRSLRLISYYVLRRRAESAILSVLFLTVLVVVFGSIAVLHIERAGGGNITRASDALWFALVAVSTAGFGDFYPITPEGRLIAAGLMITGIGLFGTFTAFVASWIMAPGAVVPGSPVAAASPAVAGSPVEPGPVGTAP